MKDVLDVSLSGRHIGAMKRSDQRRRKRYPAAGGVGVRKEPHPCGRLRYVAGADAKATYSTRLRLGDEGFREAMRQRFFG
jgi:hypothetical protein